MQGKKGKTLNDYLADAKGLLSWMQRVGRWARLDNDEAPMIVSFVEVVGKHADGKEEQEHRRGEQRR